MRIIASTPFSSTKILRASSYLELKASPIISTGFPTAAILGKTFRRASLVESESSTNESERDKSMRSAVTTEGPPPFVRITRFLRGFIIPSWNSFAILKNSRMDSTAIAPLCFKAAEKTESAGASEPVCDITASIPLSLLPAFKTTTGFVFVISETNSMNLLPSESFSR